MRHLLIDYCQIFSQIRRVVQFLQSIKANKSCESNKMENNWFCAVIEHFYKKGNASKEIRAKLAELYGTSAPSLKTVHNWVNEFNRGRTSTHDESRSGCPVEAATPEIIEKVHDMILNDRQVKVRKIVEAITISYGILITILHQKLSMTKLSARLLISTPVEFLLLMKHEFIFRHLKQRNSRNSGKNQSNQPRRRRRR